MNYLKKFLFVIPAQKKEILPIVFLFVVVSILDALGVGLVGPFMGLAVKPELIRSNSWLFIFYQHSGLGSTEQFIAVVGLAIIVVFYFKSLFYYQVQAYILRFCYAQQVNLRIRLLHTYLSLPYTFHLKVNSANVIQSVIGESANFTYSIAIPLLNSTANMFVLLVLLLLLAKTDLLATVSILGLLLVAITPFHYFRHKVASWGQEGLDANTEMIKIVNHVIGGLKEARVIGCESFFEAQLSGQTDRYSRAASRFHVFQQLPRIVIETLLITFIVGFVSLSLIFIERSENLISVLGIFAIASIRLMPSASQLITSISVLRHNKPTLDKLYLDLIELEKPEALAYMKMSQGTTLDVLSKEMSDSFSSSAEILSFSDKITIDSIGYRYPESSSNALSNISLVVKKGESVAIIGKSGAGKTTLVDVFLGLLIPQAGDIQVDGCSIYSSLRAWQNSVGYIPQTIFLIDDTVERNIAFGIPDHQIDYCRLRKAIEVAQLSELIEQLPQGLQTTVGERGILLSGGQRQRIGIARALYYEREILVLDEATSALDNETENLITEALQLLGGIKTMIIIAHRLTTVEHCDQVYAMDRGRIIKQGTYKEIVLGEQSFDSV